MKKLFVFALSALAVTGLADAATVNREKLDNVWWFTLETTGTPDAGHDTGARRLLDLPHDWSVEFDFDSVCPSGNDGGYLPTGIGRYSRTLNIPSLGDKSRQLYIEGAYMNSEVFVNGMKADGHPYGYSSYRVDLTPFLHEGDNTIEITVDNSRQKNCRWYTGSGIYRHVWLEEYAPLHIKPWSVYVTTPEVGKDLATVRVDFTVKNSGNRLKETAAGVDAVVSFNGNVIKSVSRKVTVAQGADSANVTIDIPVADPHLWSPSSPALYTLSLSLTENGKVVDEDVETFGIRTIAYSADGGFLLNGKPVEISGACVHHDNGILGSASYDDAEMRKATLLKEAGFNAVRGSHNPVSPAFLDACDRVGLMVIDESFDGWREKKNDHDYAELFDQWWESDVSAMVMRDRNHPSIICWSIGNEIIERKSPEAVKTAAMLAGKCRELDPTRPVTSALAAWDPDWEIYDPLAAQHDIVGYNYMIHKSESDHERVPSRVMWQTESYPRDAFSNWEKVNDYSYIIGDFVWTGIDYIGESGIGRYYYEGDPEGEHYHRPLWPWHNSYCGDIDIIGHRKPVSHYREMLYNPAPKLYIAVREPDGYHGKIRETLWGTAPTFESWNWAGHEGKPITVEVISNYPAVALYLDGKLIDKKPTTRNERFTAEFEIPYKPGTLKAVALDADGNEAETATLATAGKPAAIRLSSNVGETTADRQSLVYVTAEVVDAEGRVVPDATSRLSFTTTGEGKVIATGSADPKDPEGYRHTDRNAWIGRVLAVVKSTGKPGDCTVTVTSPGLESNSLKLKFNKL